MFQIIVNGKVTRTVESTSERDRALDAELAMRPDAKVTSRFAPPAINTIRDLVQYDLEHNDSKMFGPSAMRYFNSELHGFDIVRAPYQSLSEGYFITSERYSVDDPKRYTIRSFEIQSDGTIEFYTVSEFQRYPSLPTARTALKFIAGIK